MRSSSRKVGKTERKIERNNEEDGTAEQKVYCQRGFIDCHVLNILALH